MHIRFKILPKNGLVWQTGLTNSGTICVRNRSHNEVSVCLQIAEVGHSTEKEMKTVPAFLRFWSELRSCVKVEVAVLGSRP